MSELKNEILAYLSHRYKSEHNKLLERALSRIQELESQARWIPVSERLPEDDGEYLVLWMRPCGVYEIFGYRQIDTMWEGLNQHPNVPAITDDYDNEITHWMPLPEPPKDAQ